MSKRIDWRPVRGTWMWQGFLDDKLVFEATHHDVMAWKVTDYRKSVKGHAWLPTFAECQAWAARSRLAKRDRKGP